MFRPVQAVSNSRQVVEQVKKSIDDGTLAPGDRLPSERELALQFGVSRATVREAVQRLSTLGLLEVRQGVGTLVSHHATTLEDPAYWAPWLSNHREDVMALLVVREALEVRATTLAAEAVAKGRPELGELLDALDKNLADMEEATKRVDVSTLERLDLEFHVILAQMSGNRYLLRLAKSINHVFPDRRAVLALPGRAAQSLEEHRRIALAIREGRSEEAGRAYSEHLKSLQVTVEEIEGE